MDGGAYSGGGGDCNSDGGACSGGDGDCNSDGGGETAIVE